MTYGAVTCFIVCCLLRVIFVQDQWLQNSAFTSGYILLTAVVFLALFNLRKRLSFVPLGSASLWLQLHIYVAIGAVAIFLAHTGLRFPNGVFETALYLAFAATSASGVVGLYLTRMIPKRLTKLREQIIYERIPLLRRRVQRAAHQVMLDLVQQSPTEAVADLYLNRLVNYFGMPRSAFYYVAPSSSLRNRLQCELRALTRFLSHEERVAQNQLRTLIDRRDDLDYHQAQQRRLKLWLFVHIGLTVVLMGLVVMHATMAHAFSGRLA